MIACDPFTNDGTWRNSEPWNSTVTATDRCDCESTAVTYVAEPESDADEKERHDADAIDRLHWRNQAWKWAEESAANLIDAMVPGSLVIRNRGPPARRPPRRLRWDSTRRRGTLRGSNVRHMEIQEMTSGRKLTDAERMRILRLHHEGIQWAEIARSVGLDYRTVKAVICQAARQFYDLIRPRAIDELSDPH